MGLILEVGLGVFSVFVQLVGNLLWINFLGLHKSCPLFCLENKIVIFNAWMQNRQFDQQGGISEIPPKRDWAIWSWWVTLETLKLVVQLILEQHRGWGTPPSSELKISSYNFVVGLPVSKVLNSFWLCSTIVCIYWKKNPDRPGPNITVQTLSVQGLTVMLGSLCFQVV